MLNYLVTVGVIIGIMFAFQAKGLTTTEFDVVWGIITVILLFGPASAGFTYLTSFFFENPTSAMGFTIVANFLVALGGAMTCIILQIIDDQDGENTASVIIAWSLRWLPSFNLSHGILYAINAVNIDYNVKTVFETNIILYDVIMLAIESVFYIALVIWLDYYDGARIAAGLKEKVLRWLKCGCCWKSKGGGCVRCSRCSKVNGDDDDAAGGGDYEGDVDSQLDIEKSVLLPPDPEVEQEKERARAIEGGADGGVESHGGIVTVDLSKTYRNGVVAVKGIDLSVRGEVFGLLGTNGAGKTSTMKMLVGDESITSGAAYVNGFSCNSNMPGVRASLGYCPQFDAHFDNLTGREHLRFYAIIKGVDDVEDVVASALKGVFLSTADADKLAKNYSGGMKRKVSVVGRSELGLFVWLPASHTGLMLLPSAVVCHRHDCEAARDYARRTLNRHGSHGEEINVERCQ